MRSLSFAIVWFLLVAAFSAAADLLILFRLEVTHKHVELDRSLLRRIIVAFFGLGRHVKHLPTATMLTTALRFVEQKRMRFESETVENTRAFLQRGVRFN